MRTSALFVLLATTPLVAQTKAPAHPSSTLAHHSAASVAGCAYLPALSPKIPALPPGSACAKPLLTITRRPDFTLDYASPLVSPQLHAKLDIKPSTFSLDYIDTEVGQGPLALPGKWYTVRYTGYLIDGAKFDSSYDHPGQEPFSFLYGGGHVIPGWEMGFEGMHIGGKRRLFVPYQLAYGDNGRPGIPPKSELVFDVELVSQSDTQPTPPRPPAPPQSNIPIPVPHTAPAPSPAGAGAPPPVNSTTPATSTKPEQPASTEQKK